VNVDAVLRPALELYLDLHRHPELSGAEERTAAAVADRLAAAGYRTLRGIGGHGVVGVLRRGPGPTVLLRAELDGLPVAERTGLPYASTTVATDPATGRRVPVMHACGHDVHLACLVGAAELLAADRDSGGTVLVVGQPAEETLTGARDMLADGLYERVGPPDVVLAQHTAPLPAGMVAHGTGAVLAGSAALEVVLPGRGGHAGAAQLAVNPVEIAARVVLALPAVAPGLAVTAGALHAGERGNIVPDEAVLQVSLRGFGPLDAAVDAVRQLAVAECAAAGSPGEPRVTVLARSPVTVPDPAAAGPVRAAHLAAFGPARVTGWPPSMATEDVGLLAAAGEHLHGVAGIRLAQWMLGTVGPREWASTPGAPAEKLATLPPNHSPLFAPAPRPTLATGIAALTLAARSHLTPGPPHPTP
jgi:amidohydrolase